jgi:SnoaL-like domain
MYKMIVRAKLRRLYRGVAQGNWQPIVDNFADDFVYRFIGDSPLGGTRRTKAAMAQWWKRIWFFSRALPWNRSGSLWKDGRGTQP